MIVAKTFNLLISIALLSPSLVVAQIPSDDDGWFQLAVESRENEQFSEAYNALSNAERLGFAAVRIGFERARLHTLTNEMDAAVAEIEAIAASGFTSVGYIVNDPILGSLEGQPGYDRAVAAMSRLAYPCENDKAFKEFDFWIGDWAVHGPAGELAGTNTIERAERGCVLIENWRNTSGGTGMSINYVDKITGDWVQVWNAEGGSQINIRGGMTDDGMLMAGTLHDVASGTTTPFRALWTLLPDGRVRQFFEQSSDGGETWSTWFEGFYIRTE